MTFLDHVEKGMAGANKGIPCGLPNLGRFINNIQRGRLYVVGAQPKAGKTSLVTQMFVLAPYLMAHKKGDIKLKIKWFSYEISRVEAMAKFCAFFMYHNHEIVDERFHPYSSSYVLSKGDYRLRPEHYDVVKSIYDNELKELFGDDTTDGVIDFFEERDNPYGIYNELKTYAEHNGEFIHREYIIKKKDGTTETASRRVGYKPNDPNEFLIVIVDHVGLVAGTAKMDEKKKIDELGRICVELRNICNYTFVLVQQLNRDLGKIERLKFSGEDLQPQAEDFKGSGNLIEDANLVLALFNPSVSKHIHQHLGYDMDRLNKCYRSVHILQSRETECFVSLGLFFRGEIGDFIELPKHDNMQELKKYYDYARSV